MGRRYSIVDVVIPLVRALNTAIDTAVVAMADSLPETQDEALRQIATQLSIALEVHEDMVADGALEEDDTAEYDYARWHAEQWRGRR